MAATDDPLSPFLSFSPLSYAKNVAQVAGISHRERLGLPESLRDL